MSGQINIDHQAKLQILLAAAEERYKSIHIMRGRVQNTCTWTLGIFFLVSGWIIQSDLDLGWFQKFLYSAFLIVAVCIVRFCYLANIEKGFKANLRIVARIEKTLKLYDVKFFDSLNSSIYPAEWSKAGENECEGNFFKNSYRLLYVGTAFLFLAIWF